MPRLKSGRLWCLIGSSRSGKTQKTLKEVSRHRFQLVWDCEGQYRADYRVRHPSQLMETVRALAGKPCVIAYTGALKDFPEFCEVVWWYIRKNYQLGKYCAVVFEETADVTSPAKAPDDYGIILRRGLKYGVDLFTITQRPAESDKTSVGNASMVHICRLNRSKDRKYIAEDTDVPIELIQSLRADQDAKIFDYITVDTGRREYWRGTLTFPGRKARFTDSKDKKPL